MIVTEQNRLLVFERRVLRKIYGPTQDSDGAWRIKTNEELENIIKKKDIVRFIKSQRLHTTINPSKTQQSFLTIRIYSMSRLHVSAQI